MLESQRHPELSHEEHDSLKNSRAFVSWAVNDAIEKGELTTDTDVPQVVEMLVAVMWGMGFYAGYVGSHDELETIVRQARTADWPTSSGSSPSSHSWHPLCDLGDVCHKSV